MKAIYQGNLWQVVGDTGQGVVLESVAVGILPKVPREQLTQTVDYGAAGLILDPTDGELAEYCPVCGAPEEECKDSGRRGHPAGERT